MIAEYYKTYHDPEVKIITDRGQDNRNDSCVEVGVNGSTIDGNESNSLDKAGDKQREDILDGEDRG
jgi:hypothetical protein